MPAALDEQRQHGGRGLLDRPSGDVNQRPVVLSAQAARRRDFLGDRLDRRREIRGEDRPEDPELVAQDDRVDRQVAVRASDRVRLVKMDSEQRK